MPEPEDDTVVIKEKIVEITREEAAKHPELCADPAKAKEGVLDDQNPEFEASEMEAAEHAVLGQEGAGAAATHTVATLDSAVNFGALTSFHSALTEPVTVIIRCRGAIRPR